MMLQDNLKALRKEKGMSQEELASRVFVVRQTVSKWEKGLSVPDADALQKLAEVLEVPVSRLLGAPVEQPQDQNELAVQLSRLNEQLVIRNRRSDRVWKAVRTVFIAVGALAVLFLIAVTVGYFLLAGVKSAGGPQEQQGIVSYEEEADSVQHAATLQD